MGVEISPLLFRGGYYVCACKPPWWRVAFACLCTRWSVPWKHSEGEQGGLRRAMWNSFLSTPGLSLFVLFAFFSGTQGKCGPPPKLNNAFPRMETDQERFPLFHSVTYQCLDGFFNVHGKLDVATCISDSQWSTIEEFCEPRCSRPPKFKFAKIKPGDRKHYYSAATQLNYICNPGYVSIPGISSSITCLENYTWTALPVFCEGKSCGDPGKPENGEAVVLTNLLFMAIVNFTCDEGYKLIGSPSTECILKGDEVEWKTKPPQCQLSPPAGIQRL